MTHQPNETLVHHRLLIRMENDARSEQKQYYRSVPPQRIPATKDILPLQTHRKNAYDIPLKKIGFNYNYGERRSLERVTRGEDILV